MMLDRNVVAVSPSSTYRVLKAAGLLQRWNPKASRKGNGFEQPLGLHEHSHVDISYLNIAGTFFYLWSVLDGWHQSLKADCLRPCCPLSQQDGTRLIEHFVNHDNTVRLHSAVGYVTPTARLVRRPLEIFVERDRKFELARQNRKTKRQSQTDIIASSSNDTTPIFHFTLNQDRVTRVIVRGGILWQAILFPTPAA
jgi:hypothetical protein